MNVEGAGIKISIAINNFNYARFLPQCIESALNQSYPDKEVIVVDDGSTDNSREVIGRYGNRVKAVFKENGGHASAFNAGFRESSGGLVIFLDADDFLGENALERLAAAWRPGLSKIHWRLQKIDGRGNKIGINPKLKWPLPSGNVAWLQAKGRVVVSPPTSGNAFAREVLLKIMPIPEPLFRQCAETYLFARAPFFGEFAAIEESLVVYRIHGMNDHVVNKVPRSRETVWRSAFLNDIIMEDGRRCGLRTEQDIALGNYGTLKARLNLLLTGSGPDVFPEDSLFKILGTGIKKIIKAEWALRPRKTAEFFVLVVMALRVFSKRRCEILIVGSL